MKKVLIVVAVFGAGYVANRRFGLIGTIADKTERPRRFTKEKAVAATGVVRAKASDLGSRLTPNDDSHANHDH